MVLIDYVWVGCMDAYIYGVIYCMSHVLLLQSAVFYTQSMRSNDRPCTTNMGDLFNIVTYMLLSGM